MTRATRGLVFGVLAYGSWGLLPLYWPLLRPADPLEILACRIVFSLAAVTILLAARRQLRDLRRLDRGTRIRLAVAGLVIALNWGAYIWGVNNEHVVETSLGYFINPLLTIALGVVLLRERMSPAQWVAVALGALAVAVLSVDDGHPPWLALLLACSFAAYGYIKKGIRAAAPAGLFVETAATATPAVAVLTILAVGGSATWLGHTASATHVLLLVSSGPVTAIPLLFFAGAAQRLPLTSLGLLQYLAPVMQFAIGVMIRGEPLPPARLAGFALVWTALLIITADVVVRRRGIDNPVRFAAGTPDDGIIGR